MTATFSEPVYGFAVGDITVTNGTAGSFTGIDGDTVFTYIVTPNADGLVTTTVPAASAADLATNPNSVSNTISRTYDATRPTVTIHRASSQADPTNASPIHFTVVFSEPVSGFTAADVLLSGSSGATSALVAEIAPNDGTTYDVAVSGMTVSGTVTASVPADGATDTANNGNSASTSTDNTVDFDQSTSSVIIQTDGANPSDYGDALEFTVTVSNVAATPTGTIQWQVDGVDVGSPVNLDGSGQATLDPGLLTAGSHTIDAAYSGDSNFNTSSATTWNQTIDPAASTTVLSCPANVTYDGTAQEPCTYTVTGAGGLSLGPTAVPSAGYGDNTDAGTASVSYTYPGDANHLTSSDSTTFTIDPAASTTVLSCPANVTYDGTAQEPCTYTVTGAGGLSLGLTAVPSAGYGDNTDAGTASVSYTYPGDANHLTSSDSTTFTIDLAASTTVLSCPANVTYYGTPRSRAPTLPAPAA